MIIIFLLSFIFQPTFSEIQIAELFAFSIPEGSHDMVCIGDVVNPTKSGEVSIALDDGTIMRVDLPEDKHCDFSNGFTKPTENSREVAIPLDDGTFFVIPIPDGSCIKMAKAFDPSAVTLTNCTDIYVFGESHALPNGWPSSRPVIPEPK